MPLTLRPKSACAFSRLIRMMTVFDAVICGVTSSFSAASLNVHRDGVVGDHLNRNLRALRDLGLDVVLRRDARRRDDRQLALLLERGQREVEVERAVHRAERETECRGRALHAQVHGVRRIAGAAPVTAGAAPVRPPTMHAVRERQRRRVAQPRRRLAAEAQPGADLALERLVGDDDARLDLDLRLRRGRAC